MNYIPLKNKFLLIDTNVLIDFSKYGTFFEELILDLRKNGITLLIDQTVKFEFLRKTDSDKKRKELEKLLKFLDVNELGLDIEKDIIESAIEIANIYEWKKELKIELADCFLASVMRKYNTSSQPRLYLATQNHKHYPKSIFKRIGVETIDRAQDEIHNIGFYVFDKQGFDDLKNEFYKK